MAAPGAQARVKVKGGILDNWSTREKLALGCSVMRSGDQNWVSVSRAVKPYGEPHRPPDWFQPRNCATQYSNLLEKVETPKRKRGDRGEIEIPAKQIVVKLTIERMEELKKQVVEYQQRYKKLKQDLESVYSGQWDDQIKEKWEQIQAEKKKEDDAKREEERKLQEMYAARATAQGQRSAGVRRASAGSQGTMSEIDESTQDSPGIDVSAVTDEENSQPAPTIPANISLTPTPAVSSGEGTRTNPPPSPLLSHLLKSRQTSPYSLQRLKLEQEQVLKQEQQQQLVQHDHIGMAAAAPSGQPAGDQTADAVITSDNTLTTGQAGTDTEGLAGTSSATVKLESSGELTDVASSNVTDQDQGAGSESVVIKQEVKDESQESLPSSESTIDQKPTPVGDTKDEEGVEEKDATEQKPDQTTDVEGESQDEEESANYVSVDEEVPIKEEPASPASSVVSNVSETRGRRSRGRVARSRTSQRLTRKSVADDASSKHSEAELTDDDAARESDGDVLANQPTSVATSVFAESVPNSPASVGISDTEDERAYKSWKKSIMLVWRSAANHKYANVFLHPVTDDIAPGYHAVVHRPMDLVTIKKNIESGTLRTTAEFQRDMMLMFTNAVMYNSSNHNVYKMAKEMYDDVMEHIEQYVSAQLMMQSSETKVLRQSRRTEAPDKEEDSKKRRGSVEQAQEGGKAKKRKTRGDE